MGWLKIILMRRMVCNFFIIFSISLVLSACSKESELKYYNDMETTARNDQGEAQKKIEKLEKDKRNLVDRFIIDGAYMFYPKERPGKTYSDYKKEAKKYCTRSGAPTPNRGPCLLLTDHNKKMNQLNESLNEAKNKLKNSKETLSKATENKQRLEKEIATEDAAEKAKKALELAEEANKTAKDAIELAAETAVEEYTQESRWEGATDYSQSCSGSSGDLNC